MPASPSQVPPTQHQQAAQFFDRVSGSYRDKYGTGSAFHHYFFNERLEKAVQGLDLAGKDVLDIGAGTGNLYDHLLERFPTMRFHATDVSTGMLAQSHIPERQRFVGPAYEHDLSTRRFDAIFMLGVTTYMDAEELERNMAFIAQSLAPGGTAVITFTNKHGLDTMMRILLRSPLRLFGSRDKVLSSGLRTHTYSLAQANVVLRNHLHVKRWDVLNHTVFPLNLLLPGLSLRLAKHLAARTGTPAWLRFLSSDLMVRAVALKGGLRP